MKEVELFLKEGVLLDLKGATVKKLLGNIKVKPLRDLFTFHIFDFYSSQVKDENKGDIFISRRRVEDGKKEELNEEWIPKSTKHLLNRFDSEKA